MGLMQVALSKRLKTADIGTQLASWQEKSVIVTSMTGMNRRTGGYTRLTLYTTSVTTHVMRQWIHKRLDLLLTLDMLSCKKQKTKVMTA